MIVVRLMGGLGNQMFQYAAGRRLARVNGCELKFDTGWFENLPAGATSRDFQLDVFGIACQPATRAELRAVRGRELPPRLPRLLKRLLRSAGLGERAGWIREKAFGFDPAVLDLKGDAYLDGYWQCERYFADAESLIRGDFTFSRPLAEPATRLLAEIEACNAISLHIRRGDYVANSEVAAFHGTLPLEYYRQAAASLMERVADARFFVFSDDPDWGKAHLKLPCPVTFVEAGEAAAAWQDLQLMSRCRHHIIANSSFSWWGAWLNDRSDKIVIAPRCWFAAGNLDTSQLIPSGWETL